MKAGPDRFTAPRTSTILGQVKDTWALQKRDLRFCAVGIARSETLSRMVKHLSPDAPPGSSERGKVDEAVDQAMRSVGVFDKAHAGTADHSVIECIATGTDPDYLSPGERDLKATVQWALAQAGLRVVEAERVIYNSTTGSCGQFDLTVEAITDGTQFICDLKTGSVWPSENAMQIANYANADLVWRGDGDAWGINGRQQYVVPKVNQAGWGAHSDRLSRDVGLVLHAPQDTSQPVALVVLQLQKPWEWMQLARQVYGVKQDMRRYEADQRVEYPRLKAVTP